jgi:hypothetical protein
VRLEEWQDVVREIDFRRLLTRNSADDACPDDEDQWREFHEDLLAERCG